MADLKFNNVEVLLIDPDHGYRQTMFSMMHNVGIRNIKQGATMAEIRRAFTASEPDLLISETNLPDGDFCSFVYGLRHHSVGNNPFLPILALTNEPTGELVRKVVDSGSDDLLTKPLSAMQIKERVTSLVESRKPFVVTSDYIGPTRRNLKSREESMVPLLDVPNILREKATGKKAESGIQASVDEAILEINLQKLERYAHQIVYLVDHIVPALLKGDMDEQISQHITRLDYVANDTSRRLVGTKYDHISELCQTLINVTTKIKNTNQKQSDKDLRLLQHLAAAIKASFETGTAEMAREIVSSFE